MDKRTLAYRHEKNCWTVELFTDGTIVATSNYRVKTNIEHHIPVSEPLVDSYDLVPLYVFDMLLGVRYEWKEVFA